MTPEQQPKQHGRDYIERTIATVRNHRDADNCWPQWANIFADEIEALWSERDRLVAERDEARRIGAGLHDSEINNSMAATMAEEALAAARRENELLKAALTEECAECGHLDWRSDGYLDKWLERIEAAEGREAVLRDALASVRAECDLPNHVAEIVGAALAAVPADDPQDPTEGRSDEGDEGRDSPATRKCAGAEATSESVVPTSSEPSPATSSTTADSGDPGSAATGRPYDPKLDHPERYGGNNPWRPIG